MTSSPGVRLACGSCASEMLVTRGGDGEISCCGVRMAPKGSASSARDGSSAATGPDQNRLGKRYRCRHCAHEVLCTRAGTGRVACDDEVMELIESQPLASSD